MKRVNQGDINFKLDSRIASLDEFVLRFYTVNSESFFIRKTQNDIIEVVREATCEDNTEESTVTDYYIKLEWVELVTLGEGVLNYRLYYNTPDSDRPDGEYNVTVTKSTNYFIASHVIVDEEESESYAQIIAELGDDLESEISRSTSADTVISNAISAETTRATNAESALSTSIESKYSKPSGGIPKSDLASSVQTSLGKADTALQSFTETDPTVPAWAKAETKPTYTYDEVGALQNREYFYGDSRQNVNNYVNLFCDALWSAAKRWNVSVSVVNSSGETVSPMVYTPDGLFNINYEDQSLRISSGTTAKILIKGGDDIDDNSSRMFTYGVGYIYVHFYSKIEYLPNSISGRVYTHYNNVGWTNITFSAMTDYQDLPNVYKAEVPGSIAYPSALEITVEAGNSQYTSICEIEWWTKRQNMGDVPVFSKARAETLYQPLTLKNKLTVNDKVEANRFVVPSSNNNYLLLGGGNTKPISDFALASSLSSYYTKTEIDNKKFVSSSTSGLKIEVVNELPQTPDNDTIYIVR